MKYNVIYMDPPWDYKGQTQHTGEGGVSSGGALSHYSTVTLADLKRLPLTEVAAKDCLLFLWVTSPHLDQGIDLIRALGFEYKTVAFVWVKDKVNPGYYTMSQCELCLVAKRKGGRIPAPRGARNVRQLVESPRKAHSRKPRVVARRIARMFPDLPKLEVFARRRLPGWESWGNEVRCSDPEVVKVLGEWSLSVRGGKA